MVQAMFGGAFPQSGKVLLNRVALWLKRYLGLLLLSRSRPLQFIVKLVRDVQTYSHDSPPSGHPFLHLF